jgi:hypothetical protein
LVATGGNGRLIVRDALAKGHSVRSQAFLCGRILKDPGAVSRSTIYLMIKAGRFPQPVHFKRAAAWRMADAIAWQEALQS